MNIRENTMAILRYEPYDALPIYHFGFWPQTVQKWAAEGHITVEEANGWYDGSPSDATIGAKLGFDANWNRCFGGNTGLCPVFEHKVVETLPDGSRKEQNPDGVIVLVKDGIESISAEIDHLLKDRESYETYYKPRLAYSEERINFDALKALDQNREGKPLGLFVGSLFGNIRNWIGVEGSAYILADDEDYSWYDYLYRLFGHDKRFAVLVRAVGDWGGEGVHSLSILHQDTKDVLVAKHVAYLDKIGMSCHNHRNGALAQVCYASYPHSMVFRANGKIGKCTVALDHPQNQLGWVDPEKGIVIDPEVNCRWSFSDLKPECRSCRNVLRCMNMQCKKSEIIDGKTVCLYRKSECV